MEPHSQKAKHQLQTFDIFDTILARRCVIPHAIFEAVEARSGYAGFKDLRIRAESTIYDQGEYTLDDIYRNMIVVGGVHTALAERLKFLELEEEFAALFPVARHIAQVRPGDIWVSDMYLPHAFITRLVRETAGLETNPVYLSSHGKAQGKAWEILTESFHIRQHTGDNLHSDIEMPRRYGIHAIHTDVTRMTEHETRLETLGYRGLAQAAREARLRFWHEDDEMRALGLMQIELNFPFLFLQALHLLALVAERNYRKILFSSRDYFLLYQVFKHLITRLGKGPEIEYFMTSRIARSSPSPDYLAYLDHHTAGGY